MKIPGSGHLLTVLILTLLLSGFVPVAVAADEPIAVSLPDAGYAVQLTGENVLQYIDPDGVMAAADLRETDLWNSADGNLSYGYTEAAVWFRFRVVGPGSGNIWLTEHHGIDQVEVWEVSGTGVKFVGGTGWMYPDTRFTTARSVSTVALPSSMERTYLVRIASTSSMSPRLVLMGDRAYWRSSVLMGIIQGFSLSLTIIFLVFSIVIMTVHPGREIGSLVGLVLTIGLTALYITGMGPLSIWNRAPAFSRLIALSAVPLYLLASILFLHIQYRRHELKLLNRILKVLAAFTFVMAVTSNLVSAQLGFQLQTVMYMTVILGLEILLILAVVRKVALGAYMLAAWSMVLFAAVVYSLLNLGIMNGIPGIFNYGFVSVIGMSLQNCVFAAVIVIRTESRRQSEQLARQQAEASLEAQNEKIILADRMTGLATRVSVVSHEVATPLGGTRLLATRTFTLVSEFREAYRNGEVTREDFEKFLDEMAETGMLVDSSLVQALDIMNGFRVIAADEAVLNSRTIDVREFLTDFLRITEPLVRRRQHEIRLEEEHSRKSICTIPGYLSQILSNLINNAIKHAFPVNQGGTIRLRVYEGAAGELVFEVIDNGRGVPAELREQIFEMHFTTAGDDGGTGLGLAVSRSLAEDRLNGGLELIAPEDGGSLFRLVVNDLEEEPGMPDIKG